MRLGLHILALLALLIQCSPLRTCAFQYMFSGSSCHDGDLTADAHEDVALATDGCVPHPVGSHDDACVCEQPRMSADRVQHQVANVDLLPAPIPSVLLLDLCTTTGLAKSALVFETPPPSVGRSLPLLI